MREISRQISVLAGTLAMLIAFSGTVSAQLPADRGWNTPDVLDVVRRGVQRRSTEVRDTALHTYSARGDGYVYFLMDPVDAGRETLVRTDQVAVDLYWRTPGEVRQRIIGMREQRELPIVGLYYYLDRLTIVQDDYGESIVIADGDNVNEVPHPIGPAGELWYEYSLGDSLALRLPGVDDPVRVQEVRVRPREAEAPAVIGSVFLEAATGAVVRMTFTFTRSAYVDPRLDYVNVTLENGLWRGRYWLPYEQRLEIRREIPELELPFGTLIRTRMRIGNYQFNGPVPEYLFASRLPITMAPRPERENFAFDQPIDAGWRLEGFGSPPDVEELRRTARDLVRDRAISGLPAGRLALGSVSDVFRYNRAEGPAVGFGIGARPLPDLSVRMHGGWAFGADHPFGRIDLSRPGAPTLDASAYLNRTRDVGGVQAASGTANTLSSLFVGDDWIDPYYVSGVSADASLPVGSNWAVTTTGRVERHESARLTTRYSIAGRGEDPRDVLAIDPGTHASLTTTVARSAPATGGWWGESGLSLATLDGDAETFTFARADFAAGFARGWSRRSATFDATVTGGMAFGTLPRQEMYLLGGRGSLPGYDFRSFGGSEYGALEVRGAADIARPWLRGRVYGGLGWTRVGEAGERASELFDVRGSGGVKPSIGVGLGLFYDLLRVDVARGLGAGGRTQIIVEFPQNFWDFL